MTDPRGDGQGFRIMDHTADLSITAWGRDLSELVANAAAGMLALLYAGPPPAPTAWRQVTASGAEPETALQHALRELLYLIEDENLAPAAVQTTGGNGDGVTLQVGTVPLSEAKSLLGAEIKAVTRHGLDIRSVADGLEVTIVFDV